MIKPKPWNGKDLKGTWEFTLKIDGVRAFWVGDGWVSRNGKPLYNMPRVLNAQLESGEGFEVYCFAPGRSSKENYKATIERVRAKNKLRPIAADDLYSLSPLDVRLRRFAYLDPTKERIEYELQRALADGYEGLVLRQGDKWLKVKPIETYDVKVTGIIEGTGKHKGRMGALMTDMGKVGTGFSDFERIQWWEAEYPEAVAGALIEVECMQLTPAGKFRHPRFVRIRYDK